METISVRKKKILYDYIDPVSIAGDVEGSPAFKKRIERIRSEEVRGVFIITPRVADSYAYLRVVSAFERSGFPVRSIYLNSLTPDIFKYIHRAVGNVISQFREGSCMIASYGSNYTAAFIACIFIYAGKSIDEAVARVEAISVTLKVTEEERRFLVLYQRFIARPSATATPSPMTKETDIRGKKKIRAATYYGIGDAEALSPAVAVADSAPAAERVLPPLMPGPAVAGESVVEPREALAPRRIEAKQARSAAGPGRRFYTSLRFKLIFIISAVIVVSLSGMIFLATYYFKSDNRIRVQQSNLDIAKILALKVKSDFMTLIDNSKIITQEFLDPRGKRGPELITSTDRNFLFFGIAKNSPAQEGLDFSSQVYNQELLEELQIAREGLEGAGKIHARNLARAFGGEIVVENVSESLRVPVVGLSYALKVRGRDSSSSIVVNYARFDKILLAFKAEDRIGQVFMVNDRGDVIAHQDGTSVLNARNYINLPIVKAMVKSPQNNGQIRYKDENGTVYLGSFWKIGIGGCGVISTVEEDKALQQVYDMQRRNFYLMVIVLTVVIMIIFFFGTSITTPIIRLVDATKRIKEGEYRVNIATTGKDEIAELTGAFVEMGIGLEEREKMKDAFGKFVNKEIAEQVLRGELRLGGERKDAAVLFSDIRSFTAISEQLEPEEVVEFLNKYMTRMVNCVNVTNGVVDKFIGDAIMAIWGAPVSHGNDIENAVNAALMMRKELLVFNQDRGGPRKPFIKIGCGINAGPVLAGQIGSEDRMEYTVIGDTVNLASRIEALNKPFGTDILISEDAYDRVKDVFRVVPMQKIKVKGKSEPQQIFTVLGRLDDNQAPKSIPELRQLLGIDIEGMPGEETPEEVKYEILQQ